MVLCRAGFCLLPPYSQSRDPREEAAEISLQEVNPLLRRGHHTAASDVKIFVCFSSGNLVNAVDKSTPKFHLPECTYLVEGLWQCAG